MFTNICSSYIFPDLYHAVSAYHHFEVVSSILLFGEIIFNKNWWRKFLCDFRNIGGFLKVLKFPIQIKLTSMINMYLKYW